MKRQEIIDGLLETRAHLTDHPDVYKYARWTRCTCGHLYYGAMGRFAEDIDDVLVVSSIPERYREFVEATARALGWRDKRRVTQVGNLDAAIYISDHTGWYSHANASNFESAVALIDKALEVLTQEQRAEELIHDLPAAVPVELTDEEIEFARHASDRERDGMVCT